MKQPALILVRGGGDLATGTIHRLWSAGLRVLVLEAEHPAAIRRQVSLCEAVYEGEATVEGLRAVRIEALAQAEERDRLNGQKNQENEAAARAEYEKNLPAVVESTKEKLREKTEELHNCAFRLKEHLQTFYSMDQLSDDDKSLQTIDCLIYFIETHRADSIKEALREYDKAVAANQLAALESQRVSLLKQQIRMQQEQMEMTRSHQRNVEATLQQAAAQAASDRARQRDMMYVHYLNIETELGSIASNSGKIADAAELYSAKYY